MRTGRIQRSRSDGPTHGKRAPSMLILGSFAKLKKDLIPALFRIAGDREIKHIDIKSSPQAITLTQLRGYSLIFVAFEIYRDDESFFRMLPENILERVTVLARPADFSSVAPEIKCACYSSELKTLVPREEAQLLDPHPEAVKPR